MRKPLYSSMAFPAEERENVPPSYSKNRSGPLGYIQNELD